MMRGSHDRTVVPLAEFIHTNRTAILAAWKTRVARLPNFEGPSPIANGARVLEWLGRSLASQAGRANAAETASDLPFDPRFSAPRAIAELALLTDTIDQSRPASIDDAARDLLHGVIDGAIANSIARDADDSDRLRKRLRLATDVTSVGSWELEPASGVVTTDPRSRELFGIGANEAATLDVLTRRVHEKDRGRVRAGIANMLAAGHPYIDECRTACADESGVRWIAIAADAHQGVHASVPTVLGIVHDVTDGKRAEEEHARVIDELSRAVHISEMFVGILSHDLRNPLSAILGGAQLLALDAKDEKAARVLKLVVSSGERMGRMIEQLLDFTRVRLGEGIPLERDACDLGNLARDVVAEGQAGSAASLLRHTARGDTIGAWDRDRVNQILTNLVGNAIQHGRAHGAIDIVVDGRDPVRVTLSVENEGVVPAELLPVIFNPFRGTLQTRGKSRGLGLGLYVARQIALAHGGELTVVTTASGTKFTLSLPRT